MSDPWPPVVLIPERSLSDFYGASSIAGDYCGVVSPPAHVMAGIWHHGWTPFFASLSRLDFFYLGDPRKVRLWVSRKNEETYLKQQGYPHVRAIGHPIVYVRHASFRRTPGSLLVMPAHSIRWSAHTWSFDRYVEEINAIRDRFSRVVVCVSPRCLAKGYWGPMFEKAGYEVMAGANHNDRNAYLRAQRMFSSFEYVTTNSFSSLLAYAPYHGAKVSLYGSYCEMKIEDLVNDPLYKHYPKDIERMVDTYREANVRRHLGSFFVDPSKATERAEWARQELGEENKVSPEEMRRLSEWDAAGNFKWGLKSADSRVRVLAKRLFPWTVPLKRRLLGPAEERPG